VMASRRFAQGTVVAGRTLFGEKHIDIANNPKYCARVQKLRTLPLVGVSSSLTSQLQGTFFRRI